ncbi:MAG TPA: hypothetical protein VGA22_00505 [Gemmatimonadales bacterium]
MREFGTAKRVPGRTRDYRPTGPDQFATLGAPTWSPDAEAAQRSTALRPGTVIERISQWPIESDETVQGVPVRVVFERDGGTGFTDFRISRQ